jgi:hypothetical protein
MIKGSRNVLPRRTAPNVAGRRRANLIEARRTNRTGERSKATDPARDPRRPSRGAASRSRTGCLLSPGTGAIPLSASPATILSPPTNDGAPDCPAVARELLDGLGVSFSQAARLIPAGRGGRPTSPATLWRWAQTGCRGADGQRVRLEVARVGCRWLTSRPALERFLARLNGQQLPPPASPPRRGDRSARRQAEIARARAEAARLGV